MLQATRLRNAPATAALISLILMSACGGGGEPETAGATQPPPPPPPSAGSATLSWAPPTQRTDGSALTNLAGYKIRYGTSSGVYTSTITLNTVGLTTYVIDDLTPGTYYFVITALDSTGLESTFSNEASKTIA